LITVSIDIGEGNCAGGRFKGGSEIEGRIVVRREGEDGGAVGESVFVVGERGEESGFARGDGCGE
jgi:hypothetical protein